MHAAKALLEFKRKLKKTENSENKEDAKEILKEYIRKFMKNTDYQKHFEPTVTKIINEYGLMSQSGEPIIENLIKLHIPIQQRDSVTNSNQSKKLQRNYNKLQALLNSSKSSTNDSTYHKSRANSNDTHKQTVQYIPTYSSSQHNTGGTRKKRISSQEKPNNIFKKSDSKNGSKPTMKIAGFTRKPLRTKTSQKAGLETNRNRLKMKEMTQETPPARGKSEEQKFDEFIMNESETDEPYAPITGKLHSFKYLAKEERDKLIKYNKQYFRKNNKIPTTTLEYYRYVKVIGKGAFGIATLGIHKLTGKQVAIKTIKKSYIKDEYSRRKVFQEIFILKKIRHSNIIRLLEVFESQKHILLVMEYANGGDLLHFVRNVGKLPEYDTKHIFRQILYGLAHCH
jgi:hypothetical protein